jgi:hypothetical protein
MLAGARFSACSALVRASLVLWPLARGRPAPVLAMLPRYRLPAG